MTTHEIKASDLTWAEINFESPKEAFRFAAKLEKELENPNITPERKAHIDECLDDLFNCLFDSAF